MNAPMRPVTPDDVLVPAVPPKVTHCKDPRYCQFDNGEFPCACGCTECLFVRSHEMDPAPESFLDSSLLWSWKREKEREQTHVTAYGRTSVWPNDVNEVTRYLRAHGFTFDVTPRTDPSQGFWHLTITGYTSPIETSKAADK